MTQIIKILHLEDLRSDACLVERELKKANFQFELLWVNNKNDFESALKNFEPDIILSDHSLPSFNSIEAFNIVKNSCITVPFILITATISEDFAVSRIKDGVADYLLKDRMERLPSAIINALEKLQAEVERKRFLDRIIENEKSLRKTEKLARLGSWKRILSTGRSQWSDEVFGMFGYEVHEIVPTFEIVLKHIHPDDVKEFKKVLDEAVKKEENSKMTFRLIDKAGKLKWIYCELTVEYDQNGDPAALRGFNQDITERKAAEEALKKSEQFNKGVLASLSSQIAVIEQGGNIVAVNKAWEDFGKSNGAGSMQRTAVGSNYFEVCKRATQNGDKIADLALQGMYAVFNKEKPFFTLRYPCHSPTEERWFLLRIMNFESDTPKIITAHENITEMVKAEETLQKSEANLNAVVENTDAYIYSVDHNLRYLTVNSVLKNTMLKEYGLTINPGDYVLDLYKSSAADLKDWEEKYAQGFAGKQLSFIKEFNVHNTISYTSFSINPIWENNRVTALSCFARDITPQKLAEQEIKLLNESLEKKVKERTAELSSANKELEAFSYTVAHDLRAPLRIINGFVGLLEQNHSNLLNEEAKYLLQVITQNSKQMSDLVSDLLELSRVGRVTISAVSCNMAQIVNEAIEATKASVENFRACVKIHPLAEAKCDPHLIRQVWLNLISNAVKYSGKKDHPVIEIGSKSENNCHIYYVKDNGAGFDVTLSSKLFHPFQRLHKKSEYEGTGVGLALSHVIVTKHGGEMWADAAIDKGATFFFSIPD